ncbi:hypothetical protein Lal_00023676 [Lupinus albus]|uniref:Putative chitinase n=1 Tax=Lupinus albus TaxID=3870 RepID=A0A6A5PL60_LUPAL|nr:putative chitinase [Lupinus albus]KAF1898667.1 hypothetical protein Lal_00023676 [Lupinus albus]
MSSNITFQPTIFREYIGSNEYSHHHGFPSHIINEQLTEFHFILAFAKENYEQTLTTKLGDGNFSRHWKISSFSAERIHKLKKENPNVKIIISIGGRGSNFPFNTNDSMIWVHNAFTSIKNIIDDYNHNSDIRIIDGIDVNYEEIHNEENFVKCLGLLIKLLKLKGLITIASIAPSASVHTHYKKLYHHYKYCIDWVNYQFYGQTLSNKRDFHNLYIALSKDYPSHRKDYPSILLAGFSTDPSDAGTISKDTFLEGCHQLFKDNLLPGIFVFGADYSKVTHEEGNSFQVEIIAQQMIVDTRVLNFGFDHGCHCVAITKKVGECNGSDWNYGRHVVVKAPKTAKLKLECRLRSAI